MGRARSEGETMTSPASEVGSAADLPDYAPVPSSSRGVALNDQGYFVGPVERNLYWVTDGGIPVGVPDDQRRRGRVLAFGGDLVRIGHEETKRLLRRDNDAARPACWRRGHRDTHLHHHLRRHAVAAPGLRAERACPLLTACARVWRAVVGTGVSFRCRATTSAAPHERDGGRHRSSPTSSAGQLASRTRGETAPLPGMAGRPAGPLRQGSPGRG
jgi:hypothetical protein